MLLKANLVVGSLKARNGFSLAKGEINQLRVYVRNGLFHSGFTLGRCYLDHNLDSPMKSSAQALLINPKRFVKATVDDFTWYVEELRKKPKGDTGEKFEKLWDKRFAEW